jgi:CYTH domain-containing protein
MIEMALGGEGTSTATVASVVEGSSSEAARAAQPEPPKEVEAVDAMAKLEEFVRLQRDATFLAVQKTWLGSDAGGIFREVDEFTAALRTHVVPEVEIERKFLLRGMPRRKGARSIRIDQGWLPGERLLERVRRIREADGTMRYYRALKTGRGLTRREIEEETSEHVYRTLWPLTRGRRIAKRRMIVNDGDFTWEIDRFYGRDLVLAEVEVPSPETPVVPPRWLEKWVIREVTGESEYVNINLAE